MNTYDRFYSYLEDIYAGHDKLSRLLVDKADAILANDLEKLDSIIKQEQVFVLQSRGFEANIQSHRQKMGLPGENLSALIDAMDEDEKPRFRALFQRLRTRLDEVAGLNEKCQTLLEERLYCLDKAIRSLDKSGNTTYRKDGDSDPPGRRDAHKLEKSI